MSWFARVPAPMRPAALAAALALGGCASSLSGVGGSENYACKAPIGAQCTSVSGVYANAVHPRPDFSEVLPQSAAPMVPSRYFEGKASTALPPGSPAPSPVTSPGHAGPASHAVPLSAIGATTGKPSTGARAPRLRTDPRVLRLWIAPWEDSDGDLHDAAFVHVVVDTGHWLIDRVRPTPRSRLDVVTPPLASPAPAAANTGDAPSSGQRAATPLGSGSSPDVPPTER